VLIKKINFADQKNKQIADQKIILLTKKIKFADQI
jgi:hypothetical protein